MNKIQIDAESPLLRKAALRWLLACIANWLLIVGCFYLVYYFNNFWMIILSIFVIGNRQHALALYGHEGAHFMLCQNKTLNDALTCVFTFWPLGINLPGYRDFHFKHHQNLGTNLDPELEHKASRYPDYDVPISISKICLLFLKDLFFGSIKDLMILIKLIKPKNIIHLIPPFAFLGLLISTLIYFDLWLVIVVWYAANLSAFWAFFRLRIYVEHIGTKDTHRVQSNWLINLIALPAGADTHWEHHQWPTMIYHQREKARILYPSPTPKPIVSLIHNYNKPLNMESEKHQLT